ncbi:MAG: phosphoglucosamine mutase [Nanoarchaeota archaeon]|nr:phosphoglucosamine mutase [Nanoarchaeota archaeon]MBU1622689.1 phosphoglucosamine mutase [Nanoarchaeota archaeon]
MRKLFGTDGIRGKANTYPMTVDIALKVGKAAGIILRNGKKCKVVIGKDTRLSGYMIESALAAGLLSMGIEVYFVGPMPTPAIAHITRSFAADAGVVISASHNPYEDNGIKFFDAHGFKLPDDVEEKIEQLALSDLNTDNITGEDVGKAHRISDARGRYIEFAKNSIKNMSLKGLKIVLDCANGAAYHVTKYILTELGAEVILKNTFPNGKNINERCGALYPELLRDDVLLENADLAIALDGDADRVIMLDEKGEVVCGDRMMGIVALEMLREGTLKQNTLVTTVMSNLGLTKAIESAGGKVVQTKVGDRYVVEEMRKNDYNLGGEQSGHIIFLDHTTTGDGTISALQILRTIKKSGKPLSELAAGIPMYPQLTLNVEVKEKKNLEEMPSVLRKIKEIEEKLGEEGRVLVRYSGTSSKLRIMIEGKIKEELNNYAQQIADEVRKEVGV